MSLRLIFNKEASQDADRLDQAVLARILRKLDWLCENYESTKSESLSYELSSFMKLRVGDYRAIYTLSPDQTTIIVVAIRHRSEAYKP